MYLTVSGGGGDGGGAVCDACAKFLIAYTASLRMCFGFFFFLFKCVYVVRGFEMNWNVIFLRQIAGLK